MDTKFHSQETVQTYKNFRSRSELLRVLDNDYTLWRQERIATLDPVLVRPFSKYSVHILTFPFR